MNPSTVLQKQSNYSLKKKKENSKDILAYSLLVHASMFVSFTITISSASLQTSNFKRVKEERQKRKRRTHN